MSTDKAAAARTLDELRAAVSAVEAGAATPEQAAHQPSRRIPPPDPQTKDADADPYAVARAVVLRLLTGSPKSRSELEKALRRKDCPDDVAAEVLDRFEEVGLVDDAAYAQAFVRSKQAGRGLARRALSHELRKKGVDDELAQAVLDEVDPQDERARAHELVAKKLRSMHGLDRTVQTRRLAGMLARKGYGSDVTRVVVAEALDAQPEHQRD
ncbi:regulatory protein RecX [Janibacter sp. Soil728]|uniref:regulatory protein RecX n=1 Tax=Janibacter sp. Soil728 TaxID=1736393 RepID=UPI000A47B70F|nr:regulatory protein RecX [Janibacter sp. Soil728]